ncbi:hypothetical protein JTB14_015084 [Gonioctena quinquepunctata]|nr:hypothetical protein JTB14_015084 [Gonioctena quinquepunctata]
MNERVGAVENMENVKVHVPLEVDTVIERFGEISDDDSFSSMQIDETNVFEVASHENSESSTLYGSAEAVNGGDIDEAKNEAEVPTVIAENQVDGGESAPTDENLTDFVKKNYDLLVLLYDICIFGFFIWCMWKFITLAEAYTRKKLLVYYGTSRKLNSYDEPGLESE